MKTEDRYRASVLRARSARARFMQEVAAAKRRLAPQSLKAEARAATARAVQSAKAEVRATAAAHPIAIGAGASALILLIFRKPLTALSRYLYVRWQDRRGAVPETEPEFEAPETEAPEAEPEESHEQGHP